MELGVQYSFGIANTSRPDYATYIAPVPLDLPTTTTARWLTDVTGINPICSWASTNLTTPIQFPANLTSANQYFATVYLVDFNLDVKVTGGGMCELHKLLYLSLSANILSPSSFIWGFTFRRCHRPQFLRDQPHYTCPRHRWFNSVPPGPVPIRLHPRYTDC